MGEKPVGLAVRGMTALRDNLGIALGVAFVLVQAIDASIYPLLVYDEALLNDAGWQLVKSGEFRADVLKQTEGFEHHYLWQPPGLALSAAVSYFFFGLGLVQTRLPSIIFGGLAVWAIHRLVRTVSPGGLAAAIAAVTLFFWPDWMVTAKISRMDTAAIFGMLVATYVVIDSLNTGERPNRGRLFLAGLCSGGAAIFHTAALPWAASLGIVVFLFSPVRLLAAGAYGVGLCLPIALWLAYALQFPDEFRLQYIALLTDRIASHDSSGRILNAAKRYATEFARVPTTYLVFAVAVAGLILKRSWTDRRVRMLLALTAILLAVHVVVAGNASSGYYSLYPLVLGFCVMSVGLAACMSSFAAGRGRWLAVAAGAASVAFLLNIAALSTGPRVAAWWRQSAQRDYVAAMAPLVAKLKPGDQIWGSGATWLAVAKAGARLDANDWIPRRVALKPDPHTHKYVVVDRGKSFPGMDGYSKIMSFGADLPPVLGSPLANKPYAFDLWQSRQLD